MASTSEKQADKSTQETTPTPAAPAPAPAPQGQTEPDTCNTPGAPKCSK